jgi:RNA polymerase sigma factor for flagellar operon FliA
MLDATVLPTTPALQPVPARRKRRVEPLEEYLPLVWKVARQVARRLPAHVDVAELVGAGTIGLVSAMERYDPALCDRFAGYAEIRIRGAILDQLREMDWMSRSARTKRKRLDSTCAQLQNNLGRSPDASEIAGAMGLSTDQVERMRRDVISADVQRGVDLESSAVADDDSMPGTSLEHRELRARLQVAIEALPPRHQELLGLYYVEQLKLREIGEIFGVTESRVCQIHSQVIARLRESILDA